MSIVRLCSSPAAVRRQRLPGAWARVAPERGPRVPRSSRSRAALARAMSLLEIMVVITLIGLVTAAIGVAVIGTGEDARRDIALQQAREIEKALEMYHLRYGRYPSVSEGISALVRPTSGRAMMEELPLDPWGQPFIYVLPGHRPSGRPDVGSTGPDHTRGTEDDVGDVPR